MSSPFLVTLFDNCVLRPHGVGAVQQPGRPALCSLHFRDGESMEDILCSHIINKKKQIFFFIFVFILFG